MFALAFLVTVGAPEPWGGKEQLESIRLCSSYDLQRAGALWLTPSHHFTGFPSHLFFFFLEPPPLFPEVLNCSCISVV